MVFSDRLKRAREKQGVTLLQLADFIGKTEATVQRYESGNIKNLKSDIVEKIADFLHVSPAYLMGWDEHDIVSDTAPSWATTKDKMQLLDFLNGNTGFNIGPRELTEDEDRKMREILATLFWDDLAEFRNKQK